MKTVCAKEYVDNKCNGLDNKYNKKYNEVYDTCNDVDKKWKNAYNNLMKRSVHGVFDDDEQTVLASEINSGNITLSQPYTDFDFLFILYGSEVSINFCTLSPYEINRMLASGSTNWVLINGFASLFWTIKVKGTTPTFFPYASSGSTSGTAEIHIIKIIGIKLKGIT